MPFAYHLENVPPLNDTIPVVLFKVPALAALVPIVRLFAPIERFPPFKFSVVVVIALFEIKPSASEIVILESVCAPTLISLNEPVVNTEDVGAYK